MVKGKEGGGKAEFRHILRSYNVLSESKELKSNQRIFD